MATKRACARIVVCLAVVGVLPCWFHSGQLLRVWRGTLNWTQLACANGSQLLNAFGLRQLNTARPTFVVLRQPAPAAELLAPACAEAVGSLPAQWQPVPQDCFLRHISQTKMLQVYSLLNTLVRLFTARGLTIFFADGSLLGSCRHFGIIPWDDDIDTMILHSEKPQVRRLLQQLSALPEFSFRDTESANQHWQLGLLCSNATWLHRSCAIWLDLFFLACSDAHCSRPEGSHVFPRNSIFPLRPRPFGPQLLPTPRLPLSFLQKEYESYDSAFQHCSFQPHSKRHRCSRAVVPCAQLRQLYPFVSSVPISNGGLPATAEVLAHNGRLLALFVDATG